MADKKDSVREMFSLPSEIEFYRNIASAGLFEEEKRIIAKYLKKRGKVLDLGCGAGREARALAGMGHQVLAVDFSGEMIAEAKKNPQKGITYIKKDIEEADFPEKTFDCITLLAQLIEHIPGRKRRIALLRRLGMLIKDEGIIIVTTHERNVDWLFSAYWHALYALRRIRDSSYELGDTELSKTQINTKETLHRMYFHLYTRREIEHDIASAGLRTADILDDDSYGRGSKHYFLVCMK